MMISDYQSIGFSVFSRERKEVLKLTPRSRNATVISKTKKNGFNWTFRMIENGHAEDDLFTWKN